MAKHMGQNMKIIVHHDLTTLEIKKWVDKDTLFTKSYSTQALRTQLASDFHFCTLKEALDIVSVQLFSAYKGANELFVIDPAVNSFTVGEDPCKFRELNSLKWHREIWSLQREIRDVRSGWHLN